MPCNTECLTTHQSKDQTQNSKTHRKQNSFTRLCIKTGVREAPKTKKQKNKINEIKNTRKCLATPNA